MLSADWICSRQCVLQTSCRYFITQKVKKTVWEEKKKIMGTHGALEWHENELRGSTGLVTCNPEFAWQPSLAVWRLYGQACLRWWRSKAVICKSFVSNSHDWYTDGTQRYEGYTHPASETVRDATFVTTASFSPTHQTLHRHPKSLPSALLSNTQRVQMSPHGQSWPPHNSFDSDFI